MKICDLTQSYNPTSGGIRTYLHEKQQFFRTHPDHEHILIVPGAQDEVIRDRNTFVYKIKAPSIPGCEPYRFILRLDKVYAVLRKTKPDIIELGSAYILPHVAFFYRLFYPVVLTGFYHTDFPSAYVYPAIKNTSGKGIANLCSLLAAKYAAVIYNRFATTLVSSQMMKAKLEKTGVNNIEKINLGVDVDMFHPGKKSFAVRKALGLGGNQILFIYTGRLDSEKRVNLLLEAFDQVSDRIDGKFILVGEGPHKSLVQQYEQKNSRIKLLPYENDRIKLARLLASSDIYVTAGPHETFGLSIVEAQSCGLPVIGVRGGALIERVDQSVGNLGKVDSVDGLKENILDLSQNGYKQKGQKARKMVEQNYHWHYTLTKLYKIYEKLYHNKNKRHSVRVKKMLSLGSFHHSSRYYS